MAFLEHHLATAMGTDQRYAHLCSRFKACGIVETSRPARKCVLGSGMDEHRKVVRPHEFPKRTASFIGRIDLLK